jgi:2,4-dienoyl-CoA reductase-like NADH-dependent reductase (Old Yellow Enzyme family)
MTSVQGFPGHSSSPRLLSSPLKQEDTGMRQVSGATRRSLGGKQFVTFLYLALTAYAEFQRKVTDAVHARGSFIFLQLWALGRVADSNVLKTEGNFDVVAPSPIPLASDRESVPRELTVPEIKEYVQLYAKAARNAIEAGFDGVEVHAANGYLLDQFLQSVSNERTDEYGGSIQNRLRFPLEVIDAVVKAVGAERTGVRLSPWSKFQGKNIFPVHIGSSLTFFYRHGYGGPSSNIYPACRTHS